MNHGVIQMREKRIKCSMALIRGGKLPMLKPADTYELITLDKTKGSLVEQTHFFIDYSNSPAIMCVEYNYHGPRASDIEYYFRSIAHDRLNKAKVTELALFMDSTIDKTLTELKNVLNIEIKIQPQKVAHMDKDIVGQYFTGMNSIGNYLKPKFLKLEALFQSPGNIITGSQINKEANGMVKNLLTRFKGRPFNIDCFENFVVKYEDTNGEEQVFNLLKGKKEIIKEVDLNTLTKTKDWYELIEKDFNDFINNL